MTQGNDKGGTMRRSWAVLAATWAAIVWADPAAAIPAFARRYGVECHMCHQGFPKLNKTGHRFKERGFRLDQEDAFKPADWLRSIPLRARASGSRYFPEGGEAIDTGFVRLTSAGNLGSRVSYWADSGLLFDDSDGTDTYVEPSDAWVRVEILPEGKLYARAGRMELDLPFTQARTPHLFSYPVYFGNAGQEIDTLGAYHHALEVGGLLGGETYRWSAAVTSGADDPQGDALFDAAGLPRSSGDFEWNLYVRASRRGESSRLGLFSYVGRNTLAVAGPVRPQAWQDDLLRVGADADLWPVARLNVYGLYLYGRNSDALPDVRGAGGSGRRSSLHGGFVQGDYHLVEKQVEGFLKEVALALTLRGNWMRRPTPDLASNESASSVYPGVRFWLRERFRLSFEYGFEGQGRGDIGAVQAELVF